MGEILGRREEEVSIDVVLKQWWIFTPLHLSPLFIGVCVSTFEEGESGGWSSVDVSTLTLNNLNGTHSVAVWHYYFLRSRSATSTASASRRILLNFTEIKHFLKMCQCIYFKG